MCSVSPLEVVAYLPDMCSAFGDETGCADDMGGFCHAGVDDDGAAGCFVNQASVDAGVEEHCLNWDPGSDCAVLGDTCTSRRGGAPNVFGCCMSAMQNTGEELCITAENSFDGHMDCMDERDESPCMFAFRAAQCADTGIFDACFPTADTTTAFGGTTGRGANAAGRGGRGNSTFGGGGAFGNSTGRGRRALQWRGRPADFPDTCTQECQAAIAAAKDLGCLESPELLGRTLREITPQQWKTFGQICDCQNGPRRGGGRGGGGGGGGGGAAHLACCSNMSSVLHVIERLEHDTEATCNDTEAAALAATLGSCSNVPPFHAMVCEYGAVCPASLAGLTANQTAAVCETTLEVDIQVSGDFRAVLGSNPSGSAVQSWALHMLPDLLINLEYDENTVTATVLGNRGIMVLVNVRCTEDGICPEQLMLGDPDCRRGNRTLNESRFVCVGGARLHEDASAPEGADEDNPYRIVDTFIKTKAHAPGWSSGECRQQSFTTAFPCGPPRHHPPQHQR